VDAVKEIRRRKGWSQKDLAEESGVGQDTISGIESGRHEPRPSTLRKLADALDVEVADFFREPAIPLAEAPKEAGLEDEETPGSLIDAEVLANMAELWNALLSRGLYQLAQLFSDELEKVEKGDSEPSSLGILIDTLENVALGMEANVAAEKKELRARYDDEDAVRSKAVLRPAIDRLSALIGEALQKIDRGKLEVKAESEGTLTRLMHSFKRAS
jgi:transcriptional regulator with XRE-family HTH domain